MVSKVKKLLDPIRWCLVCSDMWPSWLAVTFSGLWTKYKKIMIGCNIFRVVNKVQSKITWPNVLKFDNHIHDTKLHNKIENKSVKRKESTCNLWRVVNLEQCKKYLTTLNIWYTHSWDPNYTLGMEICQL